MITKRELVHILYEISYAINDGNSEALDHKIARLEKELSENVVNCNTCVYIGQTYSNKINTQNLENENERWNNNY